MAEEKRINGMAMVGLAGMAIGAGLTAGAVALSDKKTRERVTETLIDMKQQAMNAMKSADKKAGETVAEVQKKIDEGNATIKEEVKEPIKN